MITLLLGCAADPDKPAEAETLQTLDLARDLGEQGIERIPPDGLAWDWIQTVWAYGVHRLDAADPDPAWSGYYREWMEIEAPEFEGDDPRTITSSDSLSPSLLASIAMIDDPTLDLTAITDTAHAYIAVAPRLESGAIAHWGEGNAWGFPTDQAWIDSQFMIGAFLLHEGVRTGDPAFAELFVEQYLLFSDLLRDPETQLYRHAYDDATGQTIPVDPAFWARGNSWALIAAAELLSQQEDAEVAPLFQAHAAAVAALQAEDGLWHTVLNQPQGEDPNNYTETSGSALIAYAFARGVKAGVLEKDEYMPVIAAAVQGVRGRIEEGGDGALLVEGTSSGTNPGEYEDYVSVPQVDDLLLGWGAAVLLLAEADGLEVP